MDAHEHTMDGKLSGMLEAEGVGLVEFSHKSWDGVPPHTYLDGKIPIDASYSSPDVEITNFCMLSFINSSGDHRAWAIEAKTRSLIGQNLLKTSRPAGRRLVMSQPKAVQPNNQRPVQDPQNIRANEYSRQLYQNFPKAGATAAQSNDN